MTSCQRRILTTRRRLGNRRPTSSRICSRPRVQPSSACAGRGRLGNGQAGVGNSMALKHGLRSRRPLETYPDIREWHTAQCDAITADLGGPGELTALAVATVRETARLVIVCDWLGDTLLASGPLTGKGRGTTKPKNASAQSG